MSALTGPEIARLVGTGELVIDPFDPGRVNPNSYNLEIERTVLMYKKGAAVHDAYEDWWLRIGRAQLVQTPPHFVAQPLSKRWEEPTVERMLPAENEEYRLGDNRLVERFWPGVLYLLCTTEYTETPYPYRPHIDGRSSLGRLGEFVHVTAGYGDVGFKGAWTLEVAVIQPVETFWPLQACQISYTRVEGERKDYDSPKYQGQRRPQPSRLYREIQRGQQARHQAAGGSTAGPPPAAPPGAA